MPTISIRQAHDVSMEEYRNLRLEALQKEPQAFGSSYKDHCNLPDSKWHEWLENYREGKTNWMIFASNGEKLVGLLGAFQTEEDSKQNAAMVIAMYVTEHARGKGISKLLMTHLLDKLTKETPLERVNLSVNKDQTIAFDLYKSFGFEVIREDKAILGDGIEHEEYIMEKKLR